MIEIDDKANVKLTQGNTLELGIQPVNESTGEPIVPDPGDKVMFTLGFPWKTLIEKTLTINDYDAENEVFVLTLTAAETDLPPDKYCYDCMYCFADGRAASFPETRIFEIEQGMSRKTVDSSG